MDRLQSTIRPRRAWKRQVWRVAGLLFAVAAVSGVRPADAANFSIDGRVKDGYCWSGYWWPLLTTNGYHLYDTRGPYTPLAKYGELLNDYAPYHWERQFQLTTDRQNNWWGHCDGWSAASVLEEEPYQNVTTTSDWGEVEWNVGELKGLLTACHSGDPTDFFAGARHDQGATYRTDLRAADFHRAILYYLWKRNEGVIFNVTDKPEVWNYPAYRFSMTGQTYRDTPDYTYVTTTVRFADDDVKPDYVGRSYFERTYTYWVKGNPENPTAAEWLGSSITSHPQFVWHPAYQQAEVVGDDLNPINYGEVRRFAAVGAGYEDPGP